MLIAGVASLVAGAIAANQCDRTFFPSQILLQENVSLYPSESDIHPDKKYQIACPGAFPAGSHLELHISVIQRISSVTDIAGVSLWRRVYTSATTGYWDRSTPGSTTVPDDALRAAMECVPSLRGRPIDLLKHAESTSILVDWRGTAAAVLIPLGILLTLPALIVLPIRTLRRLRRERALTGA